MGWSCRAEADKVVKGWSALCRAQTDTQDRFCVSGAQYFWTISRTEHDDGAITGSVLKITRSEGDSFWAVKVGSFRIDGDGKLSRAPKILRDWLRRSTSSQNAC